MGATTLTDQDLSLIQQAVAATIAAMRGGAQEKAFDPSTGTGFVKAGNRDQFFNIVPFPAAGLAPAAVTNQILPISADADFYWNATSYQADNHGSVTALTESTNPIPLITVLVTDTGSSRQLMNAAVPVPSIAGDGKRPYRLLYPRLFRRTTSINFTFQNLDTALTLDLSLVLHGFKVYSNTP